MKKVRSVLLFSMGLALLALMGLCTAGAAAPADTASAAVPSADTASEAITAAGQPSECECEDELSCSCACSPLAGSWIASLWPKEYEKDAIEVAGKKDGKDGKDADGTDKKVKPTLKTFKFAPVNDKCDKFVVNAQAVTRPQRVCKAFSEVTDLTEFVGIACKAESEEVNFTAISFGVERTKEADKAVLIAVLSGTIELPDEWSKDKKYSADAEKSGKDDGKDKDRQKCNEPEKLDAELTVAFFDVVQDENGDGFPDEDAEPVVCLTFKAELKRVVLQPQCKPTKITATTAGAEVQG
jgi:hypothetical protein